MRTLIVLTLLLCLTASFQSVSASGSSVSFIPETDQSELPVLLQGCAAAASSITSGKGKVTHHETYYLPTGDVRVERETKIDVAFSGKKLSLLKQITPIKEAPIEDSKHVPVPSTVRTKRISSDGSRVTILDSSNNSATISTPDKGEGWHEIHAYRRDISIAEAHGIWDIGNLNRYITLPKDMYSSADPKIVGRETLGGDECMVIEVLFIPLPGRGEITQTWWFWVNPNKGFTVPRVQHWNEGGFLKGKELITEWDSELRQYADGMWGPANTIVGDYRPDKDSGPMYRSLRTVTTCDPGFQVNVPVSDADISLSIPSGTNVHDELLDADYVAP